MRPTFKSWNITLKLHSQLTKKFKMELTSQNDTIAINPSWVLSITVLLKRKFLCCANSFCQRSSAFHLDKEIRSNASSTRLYPKEPLNSCKLQFRTRKLRVKIKHHLLQSLQDKTPSTRPSSCPVWILPTSTQSSKLKRRLFKHHSVLWPSRLSSLLILLQRRIRLHWRLVIGLMTSPRELLWLSVISVQDRTYSTRSRKTKTREPISHLLALLGRLSPKQHSLLLWQDQENEITFSNKYYMSKTTFMFRCATVIHVDRDSIW